MNTNQIQQAIDSTAKSGGGTISIPPGIHCVGTLELRDNIHLHLEAGSTLLGSTSLDDYPIMNPPPVRFYEDSEGVRGLLIAKNAKNITISGQGTIDGQGSEFNQYSDIRAGRPRNIWMCNCQNVRIEGLSLRNSGFWMQHYIQCSDLHLSKLNIFNHGSFNNDGLDIDSCQNVIVSDCRIDSHDDAICLKSGTAIPTKNVVITNCITSTHCNHIKTGTESNGGFQNIRISNIQMIPSKVKISHPHTEGADWRGACGIMLGCVDAGIFERASISNIQMHQTRVPICIRNGDRRRPVPGTKSGTIISKMKHISICGLTATEAGQCGCAITGIKDSPIMNLSLDNLSLEFEGDSSLQDSPAIPAENRKAYPSCDAYGDRLPAYGFFLRNVNGAHLSRIRLSTISPDARSAVSWIDCNDIRFDDFWTS